MQVTSMTSSDKSRHQYQAQGSTQVQVKVKQLVLLEQLVGLKVRLCQKHTMYATG
jgi:hypothetical protein